METIKAESEAGRSLREDILMIDQIARGAQVLAKGLPAGSPEADEAQALVLRLQSLAGRLRRAEQSLANRSRLGDVTDETKISHH